MTKQDLRFRAFLGAGAKWFRMAVGMLVEDAFLRRFLTAILVTIGGWVATCFVHPIFFPLAVVGLVWIAYAFWRDMRESEAETGGDC